MQCPLDQTTLLMTHREGIEIDYCPTCRGVWLDRGELDKLIEAGSGDRPASAPRQEPLPETRYSGESQHRSDDRYKDDRYKYEKKKKKESFLSDLFDF